MLAGIPQRFTIFPTLYNHLYSRRNARRQRYRNFLTRSQQSQMTLYANDSHITQISSTYNQHINYLQTWCGSGKSTLTSKKSMVSFTPRKERNKTPPFSNLNLEATYQGLSLCSWWHIKTKYHCIQSQNLSTPS